MGDKRDKIKKEILKYFVDKDQIELLMEIVNRRSPEEERMYKINIALEPIEGDK